MRRFAMPLFMLPLLVVACSAPPPPEPEEEAPPPPPTAQEIETEFRGALGQFNAFKAKGAVIPPQRVDQGIQQITQIRQKHEAGINGPEGIRKGGNLAEQMLKEAVDSEAWHLVMFAYRAIEVLDPSNASNYETFRNLAVLQVNRPQVTLKGIYEDHAQDATFLFCEVFFPPTRKTVSWQAQIGDCWRPAQGEGDPQYEICLTEVIGDAKGARFRYTPTEEYFDVRK